MHTAMDIRTIADVIRFLDERASPSTAEGWDNVGLLVGGDSQDLESRQVSGTVVSIDLTHEALDLAISKKANLIINHHPCIFPKNHGLSRVVGATPLIRAIQNHIAVVACHTNFDRCALEVIDLVSRGFPGLVPRGRLTEKGDLHEVKESRKVTESILSGQGYGFWGNFPAPRAFSELAKDVKRLFDINGFWITNPAPTQVSRIGFVAGKGASFLETALALGCDLFITGEVGYHNALSGLNRGMAVMEIGHRESEKFFVETMRSWLLELGLDVAEAQTPTQKIDYLGGVQ